MGDIEEASKAKVTSKVAATFFDPPPGFWEMVEREREARKAWLQTVPGRWWQAKKDARDEAANALLKQLEELGIWVDEEYVGDLACEPDALKLLECSDCDAGSIEDCRACDLWLVVDG